MLLNTEHNPKINISQINISHLMIYWKYLDNIFLKRGHFSLIFFQQMMIRGTPPLAYNEWGYETCHY